MFLGPVRKLLLWICYYLAIILFWHTQTYCPIDRWHWLMRSHFLPFSCFLHNALSRSTSRGEFYTRSADRKPELPHKSRRHHVYATNQVHNHTRQHAKELTWPTEFGLCVSKTCGNCAGNGIPIFAINPDAQRSSQAFNVKIFFFVFFFFCFNSWPYVVFNPHMSFSTLCRITVSLSLSSSKHSSSQRTFLGNQTQLVDLSLTCWQSWASCQHSPSPPPPSFCLVLCDQTSRVCCMLTIGWSGRVSGVVPVC